MCGIVDCARVVFQNGGQLSRQSCCIDPLVQISCFQTTVVAPYCEASVVCLCVNLLIYWVY